jgi:quercetin dioxygenase-like cupin family protein
MREDKISCVNGMFVRQMHFKYAGDIMESHDHVYDHQTLLAYGSVEAEVNGVKTVFTAPQMIFIKAGKTHKFTALEPNTVAYCIHPLEPDDDKEYIVDPESVPYSIEFQPGKYRPLTEQK